MRWGVGASAVMTNKPSHFTSAVSGTTSRRVSGSSPSFSTVTEGFDGQTVTNAGYSGASVGTGVKDGTGVGEACGVGVKEIAGEINGNGVSVVGVTATPGVGFVQATIDTASHSNTRLIFRVNLGPVMVYIRSSRLSGCRIYRP